MNTLEALQTARQTIALLGILTGQDVEYSYKSLEKVISLLKDKYPAVAMETL